MLALAVWPFGAGAAEAAGSHGVPPPASAPATTTTTLPPLPKVPLSITDGLPAQTLLSNAIALASVGVDGSAVQAAIAATQQKLDLEAVTAQQMRLLAAQATQQEAVALATASTAQASYQSLDGAVKTAALFLYTNGPSSLTINPAAGDKLAYAADYADTAITPNGVLATRSSDAKAQRRALAVADKAQKAANRAAARAAAALAAEQAEQQRLSAELQAIAGASAAEVLADHTSLAAQAGSELLSTSALQFTPKAAIPAPLRTTPVALTWAFSELGKSYVWAATGPNTFDCSGLTQYVWRQAGVAIPRVAADQDTWTIPVPLSQLLPGDLVFFGRTDVHHVGIYIGDGLMINAPHTGDVVRVSSIWWSDLSGFGRVHAAGTPVPLHQPPSTKRPAPPVVVPTAGAVPSQTKPPPGWKPKPGSSTPFQVYPGAPKPPSTTTTTVTVPSSSTTTTTLGTVANSVPVTTILPLPSTTVTTGTPPST